LFLSYLKLPFQSSLSAQYSQSFKSLADLTKPKTTTMSPTNSTNPPNPNFNGTTVTASNNDLRCRLCGHNRSKCSFCQTPRSHSSAADRRKAKKVPKIRRKAYCCKCKHKSKLVRFFDPNHKEKLALIKYTELKIDAAAKLRSYILEALKSEQWPNSPTICGAFYRMDTRYDDQGGPGSSAPSLVVFNCRIPDHNNVAASDLLEHRVLQVENIVLRLILLLSNEGPIDTGILRTILRTLFNQLATLTHRAFPALMPNVLVNRKAFQHSLRVAGRSVQTVYKELWAMALQTGVLKRSRGYATSAGGLGKLETLSTESGERTVVPSHDAVVQQLLWKSRKLADELRFWLALLRAGRSL
jgi:hypothetical protein